MYFYIDFLVAILVILFVTALIAAGLRKSRILKRYISIFLLFLLAVWAGGVWIAPLNQDLLSIYILSAIIIGLIVVVIFAIIAYPNFPIFQKEEKAIEPDRTIKGRPVSVLFWVLLGLFILTIVAGYILRGTMA